MHYKKTTTKISLFIHWHLLPWKLDLSDIAVDLRIPSKTWIFPAQVKVVPLCFRVKEEDTGDKKSITDLLEMTIKPDGQQLFVKFKSNYIIDDHLQRYLGTLG